jgi:hypothetical protein
MRIEVSVERDQNRAVLLRFLQKWAHVDVDLEELPHAQRTVVGEHEVEEVALLVPNGARYGGATCLGPGLVLLPYEAFQPVFLAVDGVVQR